MNNKGKASGFGIYAVAVSCNRERRHQMLRKIWFRE